MNTTNSKLWAFFVSFVMLVSAFAMVMTSESAEASTGGNDGWGYYYVDNQAPNPAITYNWIDTTMGGTVIFPHADDDEFGPFRIGFPFVFYGNVFGEFCIGNNGGITFNTQPACENIWAGNDPIPSPGEPDNLVAPFWTDLFEQGEIRYLLAGIAPYRVMVVEWYRVDTFANQGWDDLTFELMLFETTNVIRFQYFDTFYGGIDDFGIAAVAGIENWDGTVGVEYSYLSPSLFDGLAVEFHPVRQTHYFDDVDVPGSGWTTDGMWHVADESIDPCYGVVGPPPTHPPTAFSSPNAFAYHDDATCNYDTPPLANIGNLMSPPIDLTAAVTARLTFMSWWDSEGGMYDNKNVQVSTDNVTFNTVYMVDWPEYPWQMWNLVAVNLNQYVGGVIWIRFQFDTVDEAGNDMAGWYVDDINIDELIAPWPTNVALFKNMDAWGNPSNEDALNYWGIPYTLYDETAIGMVILNPYDKVIIVSDQNDTFYAAVEGNVTWFEAYVASGGVLEIHAGSSGWNGGTWPGGDVGDLPGGFEYTGGSGNNVTVTEPTHTILNDPNAITAAELQNWGSSYHGTLTLTPGGSLTILDDGVPLLSELVVAPYNGYIVTGLIPEWAYFNGDSVILENMVLYMPFPSVLDPPMLFNEWLDPWFGNEFTGFNFTVLYSDVNNDPPEAGHPLVHILDSLAMDIPGSPFSMNFNGWLGAPGDYVTGAGYYFNTTLPCPEIYNFYMETNDITGLSYVGGTFGGPTVICGYLPVLSWTGEPYFVADGLNPDWGDAATVFEWRVMYTDLDNEAPEAGHPILTINENFVPIPGGPFTMNEVDPFDIDYTDGKLYTYSQTLTCGNYYDYWFDGNDTAGNMAMSIQSAGPQVFCNDAPYFDWTGEPNYVADGLDPETGNPATVFTYRIDFYDNDQHLPSVGTPEVHILDSGVELAGSPIPMMEDDPIIWYMQEDFETGSPGWVGSGLWHEVDDANDPCALPSIEGSHSWGYHGDSAPPVLPGRLCSFDVDDGMGNSATNSGDLVSPLFDLSTATTATLSFWTWFDTEGGATYDQKWIRISPDGLVWTDLIQLQGGVDPMREWFQVEIDLTAFIPGSYYLGFFFDTWDEIGNNFRGWFVDDVWVYEGDGNTTDGKRYTLDVLIDCGVSLSYYFTGMDEKGLTAIPTTELFAPIVACGPELDWTGEPNFVSDGLDPQVGDTTTNFEYRIQYSDRNNDAPAAGYPWVHILELGVDIAGSPFTMNPLSWVGAGGDYVAGRIYTYSTTLPVGSDYSYYFYAEDGGALTNQTATLLGPLVTVPGDAPVLDWTGEANFVSDGLNPQMGDTTATFEYRIQYSDADNDAPGAGYPVVHVLDGGFDIVGSPFTMAPLSWVGAVDDYVDGRRYTYSTMLPVGADYSYYFYAEDIVGRFNLTITLLGPVVTPVGNDPPEAGDLTVDNNAPGSVGILHITEAFPTFAWSYSDPEAQAQTDYELRVGSAPGLNDLWPPGPAGVPGLTDVYNGGPLVPGTDYYFGVRVMDDAQWSPWNETLFHMNAVPPAPTTPVDPLNAGLVDAGTGMTVSWTPGGADPEGDIVTYEWQVATDMGFAAIIASGSTTGTSSDGFDTVPTTTYYWRVNATDGYGWSAYGNDPPAYWTFDTTAVVDNAPEARFPGVGGFLDGTGGILHIVSDTPTLNWTYNDTEGSPQAEYEVKVGTQSGLGDMWSSGAVAQPDQSVVYAGAQLVDGTDYYFAVRVNDGGKWGAWAEVMFHMNTPPPAPTLDLPADQATDIISGSIDLGWNTVTDAEGDTITYYWYLSEQSDFTPLEDSGNTGSTTDSTTVQPETTYYWKVEAYDGYEFGANSTVFEFTTIADTGSITGTVRDDATNDFIPSAIVELLDSNDDVVDTDTTNVDGEFAFTDLDFGTYSVRVTKSGYNEHLEEDVTIYSGHDENLGIRLTERVAEEFDWMLIWILLIIIIIIIAVLLILLLKRRKKPEEVPPEEQPPEGYPDQPPQQEPPQQPQPQPEMPPEQPPPAEPQPVEPQPAEPPAESE